MGKIYEHETVNKYFGILYLNPQGGKGIAINNVFQNAEDLRAYWDKNEAPKGYKYLRVVEIKNAKAYEYYTYWGKRSGYMYNARNFDLFKYVFDCDFGEEYKPE